MKFGRLFTMAVEGGTVDEFGNRTTHYISFPLTCRFQIVKQVTFNTGHAIFRLYNLARDVRNDLYQDCFQIGEYRKITFAAGYQGEELPQIFQGNVKQAYSYRQGPDWITEIEGYDGGSDVESIIAQVTKPAGYSVRDLALSVIAQFEHVTVGALGDLETGILPSQRGITMNGNAWDLITRSIRPNGGFAFINNEKINIVNQWEYILNEGGVDEISSETGMIGSPLLFSALIKVRTIYEPRLEPAQKIHLTTIENRMSGDYIIMRLIHQGTISGAVCEDLITEATLFQPNRTLSEVVPLATAGLAA